MKRLTLILMLLAAGLMAVSYGHSDELDPNEITRVQDGNGKAFIENGVLVDANTDFSSSQLSKALNEHEWVRVSSFHYDNKHVGGLFDIPGAPLFIHKNGTVGYDPKLFTGEALVRNYTIKGREMTVKASHNDPWSSSYYPDEVYTIVSVDANVDFGRIIMDRKVNGIVDGFEDYDSNSLYQRFVWVYNDSSSTT